MIISAEEVKQIYSIAEEVEQELKEAGVPYRVLEQGIMCGQCKNGGKDGMERPYVICHILSSLDGKITGPFMGTEAVGALGAEYGKYRTKMNADAWLYRTTTTKEFTGFRKPVLKTIPH